MTNKIPFIPSKLTHDLDRLAKEYDLRGCMVAVHDGGTIYRRLDNRTDQEYFVDGRSGLLLGLAVLMLYDDGDISLGHRVERFAPEWVPVLPRSRVTVVELLQHISGLPDGLRRAMARQLPQKEGEEAVRQEREFFLENRAPERQLEFLLEDGGCCGGWEPAPSSVDDSLLSLIVERVSGCTPEQLIAQRMFDPYKIEYDESNGVFSLTACALEELLSGLTGGDLLDGYALGLAKRIASSHAIPFAKRDGLLWGSSYINGSTVELVLHPQSETGLVIALNCPMPWTTDNGVFRQLDTEAAGYISAQLVYPAHTRMERIKPKNLSSALAIHTDCADGFTLSPAADMAHIYSDMNRWTFVATEGGVAVGLLSVCSEQPGESGRIDTLLVDSRFRRRGFGRIMCRWALEFLREKEMKWAFLYVNRENQPALQLYRSLGFELHETYEQTYVMKVRL